MNNLAEYILIISFLFDTIIGDPKTKYHPVALIGKLIAFLETLLLKCQEKPQIKKFKGGLLVLCLLGLVYGMMTAINLSLSYLNDISKLILSGLILSFTISPRALSEAGFEIKKYLDNNDLITARQKVSWIVGRDTENLEKSEIARATIETVAENIVDGVIAPLFYFLLGGISLAFVYRAVNTMDSMLGYKNDKYQDFGFCAAKVDDIFNYFPARITGVLIVLVSIILRLDYKNAFKMILRDAAKHPSPNSGISEAGVAGALNIRLGGLNYYFGRASMRAYMGDADNVIDSSHIAKTNLMMYSTTIVFILGSILIMRLL